MLAKMLSRLFQKKIYNLTKELPMTAEQKRNVRILAWEALARQIGDMDADTFDVEMHGMDKGEKALFLEQVDRSRAAMERRAKRLRREAR